MSEAFCKALFKRDVTAEGLEDRQVSIGAQN